MASDEAERYLRGAARLLASLERRNRRALRRAAGLIARTIREDGLIHVFGTGHSSLLAQEAFFRAGGLVNVNPLIDLSVMVYHRPMGAAKIERSVRPAAGIFRTHRFEQRDTAILASNSGRNVLPVEVARRLAKMGVPTIGISSLRHARSAPSRHPSGKNLVEVVDVALDNGGAVGDASIRIAGGARMGPTSAIAGFALLHAALAAGAAEAARRGARPPVLESANLRGKRLPEYRRLFRGYARRIRWLR